ncbi:hypothetical protein NDU88_006096 [Pleurodeles waltl]|uniref:Uncharacterized protein n=1 Tax=Pleurodeles waltl TaxID=8319 RepID=A0AAV7TWM9_PLEWA|nr:hypothetical protein NDU88_006096 [Pleurodeles waltl]
MEAGSESWCALTLERFSILMCMAWIFNVLARYCLIKAEGWFCTSTLDGWPTLLPKLLQRQKEEQWKTDKHCCGALDVHPLITVFLNSSEGSLCMADGTSSLPGVYRKELRGSKRGPARLTPPNGNRKSGLTAGNSTAGPLEHKGAFADSNPTWRAAQKDFLYRGRQKQNGDRDCLSGWRTCGEERRSRSGGCRARRTAAEWRVHPMRAIPLAEQRRNPPVSGGGGRAGGAAAPHPVTGQTRTR